MADKKITDPTIPLATNIADNDVTHIVDVSDPTDDPAGTSKRTLFSLVKSTLKTYFDTLYSSYSEWATYTGTRAGGDLVTTIGDYDDSGNGVKIIIDNSNNTIETFESSFKSSSTIFAGANVEFIKGNNTTLSASTSTALRNIVLPDASGTVALTSDIRGGDYSNYVSLSGDNEFVVEMRAAIRPTVASQVNGEVINWNVIEDDTHFASFIDNISVGGSTELEINYPTVKKISSVVATSDESYLKYGQISGGSITVNSSKIQFGYFANYQGRVRGNGLGGWSNRGFAADGFDFDNINNTTGQITATQGSLLKELDPEAITLTYTGKNNYRIERDYSFSSGKVLDFIIIDNATNLPVLTNPTSDDSLTIIGGMVFRNLRLNTYSTSTVGGNSWMFTGNFNFWVFGTFELFMKVWTSTATSLLVKWQSKSGVTNYKLYRDTDKDFVTETLIYSGTDLIFEDTGLITDTLYYYRLDDQTDTEITRFWNKTKDI